MMEWTFAKIYRLHDQRMPPAAFLVCQQKQHRNLFVVAVPSTPFMILEKAV
jgi:hypothetical protein